MCSSTSRHCSIDLTHLSKRSSFRRQRSGHSHSVVEVAVVHVSVTWTHALDYAAEQKCGGVQSTNVSNLTVMKGNAKKWIYKNGVSCRSMSFIRDVVRHSTQEKAWAAVGIRPASCVTRQTKSKQKKDYQYSSPFGPGDTASRRCAGMNDRLHKIRVRSHAFASCTEKVATSTAKGRLEQFQKLRRIADELCDTRTSDTRHRQCSTTVDTTRTSIDGGSGFEE